MNNQLLSFSIRFKLVNIITNKLKDIHIRELFSGSSIAFILNIFGIGVGYFFTMLITRNFGAEAMGIFALSSTLLSIVAVIGKLGFDTALLRFVAQYSSQGKYGLVKEVYVKAIMIVIPCCLILSLMLFFSSSYIAKHIFGKEYLSSYFKLILFAILPMSMIFINTESLRGLKKIKEYSFLQNISVNLFTIIFLFCSVYFINEVQYFVSIKETHVPLIVFVGGVILTSILSFVFWIKDSRLIFSSSLNKIRMKELLNVSLPMLLSSSIFLVMRWTDTIMLGIFSTERNVGIYNVASKVSLLTSISLAAINSIAAPKFAEFYGKNDMHGLKKMIQYSTKMIFWSSLPLLICFFSIPSLILGLFGLEFKAGAYALLFLTFGQFINAISGSVGFVLQMTGRQKIFQNIIIIAGVINIILNAILIPKYGINGAAFASMMSMTFWNISSVFYIKRTLNICTIYLPLIKNRA